MAINSSTVDAFLEHVGHIIQGMRKGGSLDEIRAHAEDGRRWGELITIHPEFMHGSSNNGHSVDPATAVNTLLDTLVCLAAIQQQQHHQPEPGTAAVKAA